MLWTILSLLLVTTALYAQPDSCFCALDDLGWPGVSVDTCGVKDWFVDGCPPCVAMANSYPERTYSITYFIDFEFNPFKSPLFTNDSVNQLTWQDIDSAYNNMRSAMKEIEEQFGSYTISVTQPDLLQFDVAFESRSKVMVLLSRLRSLPHTVRAGYNSPKCLLGDVKSDLSGPQIALHHDGETLYIALDRAERPIYSIEIFDVVGALVYSSYDQAYDFAIPIRRWFNGTYALLVNKSIFQPVIISR